MVVMGVAGSGKTTIGLALAQRTGRPFLDADTVHPAANIEKMAAGTPLSDADRWPWLDLVAEWIAAHPDGIVGCSALKRAYRDRLRAADPHLRLVYLAGTRAELDARLVGRSDHFFPRRLLDAQLADLEEPTADERPIVVHIGQTVEETVTAIAHELE